MQNNSSIHPSAIIEEGVKVSSSATVWHHCHLRKGCQIGEKVSLGKGVFVDSGVIIGRGCRVQNGVSVYHGVELGSWVFVGPNVTFTNDKTPRAGAKSWVESKTILEGGCSIGAGSAILSDLTIEGFAMVGAASTVSSTIPAFHLAMGTPARIISKICACGVTRLELNASPSEYIRDCCRENLNDEVIEVALNQVKNLQR